MSHTIDSSGNTQNLGAYDRIFSAVSGSILIGFVFTKLSGSYLGWSALLPIIAIYPCFCAITGYSPIRALFGAMEKRTEKHLFHYAPQQNGHMNILSY